MPARHLYFCFITFAPRAVGVLYPEFKGKPVNLPPAAPEIPVMKTVGQLVLVDAV